MKPDYEGRLWAIYLADCVELLSGLPDYCIDASVFSSPFSSLYIYSDSERDMGNAASHEEFLEHHAYMARELYRVMKPGTVINDHVKDTVFYANSSATGESVLYPFSDAALANYRAAGFILRGAYYGLALPSVGAKQVQPRAAALQEHRRELQSLRPWDA